MKFTIEKAQKKDYVIVLHLLTALYSELGEEAESLKFLSEDFLDKILQSGRTEVFLIKDEDSTIGVFTLTESHAIYAGGKYGVMDEMFIELSCRSKGVGRQVIEFSRELAKESKWKRIDVTAPTEERWERTSRFYEKNGFVFTGPKYKLRLKGPGEMEKS